MQTARKTSTSVFQEIAEVVESDAAGLRVRTESGTFSARRAVSCLVEPEAGDRVLLAVPGAGDLFVLAVLSRDTEAPIRLPLGRDASLSCDGTLSLFAARELELRAAGEVSTVATKVSTAAVESSVVVDRLRFVGRFVEAHTEQVKGVLGIVDTVLERLSQKMKRSYRYVEEIDMTRAKQVDLRAEETLSIRSDNAFVTADALMKIQGEQIHLG